LKEYLIDQDFRIYTWLVFLKQYLHSVPTTFDFCHLYHKAATVDIWQARMSSWWPLHWRATAAAVVFYFSKSSQGPSLGCFAYSPEPFLTKHYFYR
jgi:hypothetical protein